MEEQKVYVVYEDGQPYKDNGKKIAYLQERHAKQLITTICNKKLKYKYRNNNYGSQSYWNLSNKEKLELSKEFRNHFEIRVFIDSGIRI